VAGRERERPVLASVLVRRLGAITNQPPGPAATRSAPAEADATSSAETSPRSKLCCTSSSKRTGCTLGTHSPGRRAGSVLASSSSNAAESTLPSSAAAATGVRLEPMIQFRPKPSALPTTNAIKETCRVGMSTMPIADLFHILIASKLGKM